jgi:hypothetical protein
MNSVLLQWKVVGKNVHWKPATREDATRVTMNSKLGWKVGETTIANYCPEVKKKNSFCHFVGTPPFITQWPVRCGPQPRGTLVRNTASRFPQSTQDSCAIGCLSEALTTEFHACCSVLDAAASAPACMPWRKREEQQGRTPACAS